MNLNGQDQAPHILSELESRMTILEVKLGHTDNQLANLTRVIEGLQAQVTLVNTGLHRDVGDVKDSLTKHIQQETRDRIVQQRYQIGILLSVLGAVAMLAFQLFVKMHGL